jgi:hypothetical protein
MILQSALDAGLRSKVEGTSQNTRFRRAHSGLEALRLTLPMPGEKRHF